MFIQSHLKYHFGSDVASDLSSPRNNRTYYHRRYNNNGKERGRGRSYFNRNYHNQGRNQGRNELWENKKKKFKIDYFI